MAITTRPTAPTGGIGEHLAAARQRTGYTQQQLADLLGVSRATISNTEQGHTKPSFELVAEWAHVCGLPLEHLAPGQRLPFRDSADSLAPPGQARLPFLRATG